MAKHFNLLTLSGFLRIVEAIDISAEVGLIRIDFRFFFSSIDLSDVLWIVNITGVLVFKVF